MTDNDNSYHIRLEGLGKSFQDKTRHVRAFDDLNLRVRHGEFVCVVGPSGCGKTTMLRCLAGIETPTDGVMEVHRAPEPETSPRAMVFQQHGLYPWMTVQGNLKFVLDASPIPPEQHEEIIDRHLTRVGLSRFKNFYPYQLSGGMNQRLSLVRAFCVNPQLLLMDEPFVYLDYQNRVNLQALLLELWSDREPTIVFVTHNINEAFTLADRVMVMTRSPGTFKREVACDFPRPRDVLELRKNTEFQDKVFFVTQDLKEEIQAAARLIEEETARKARTAR
ncbi:MAG: ABC transporter ATP-binding protein [Deltaproteobacteria bacterium]|nr:ABC transporter ATP-binding protein [Deltaproteobacteria bacterium]MCB9489896.1 ABC transporter ATP-binding protein [Deltaproteobacteria bacterium]